MVVTQLIYENLLEFDVDGNLKPQLAIEMPKISADGLVYDFTLRPNVTFSNGAAFTAEDVKYSFDWMLDPKNKTIRRPVFARIKEVAVIDPMHVRFTLSEPFAPWLSFMTKCMGIFPKGSREAHAPDYFSGGPKGMGTGPAVFDSWQANDHVKLVRNPNHWNKGVPAWETLIVRQLQEDAARVAYIRTGQADIISAPPPREFAQLQKTPGLHAASRPTLGGWYAFYFNTQKPPFNDVHFRRAVCAGIDRDLISKRVYFGLVEPSATIAPKQAWWYDEKADKTAGYDFEAAKAHLAKSKNPNGATIEMIIPSSPYLIDVRDGALVVQSMLKKLNITVNLKVMELTPLLGVLRAGEQQSAMWIQMSPGEPTFLVMNCLSPDQVMHGTTMYNSDKFNSLLKQGFATPDRDKAKPIYSEMAQLLAEDSPICWIGFVHAADVWRDRVHDLPINQGLTIDARRVKLS